MSEYGLLSGIIDIIDIEGFFFGNAQDVTGATGCTAIIAPEGACAGVDIRGGGPATRETDLLAPDRRIDQIHAVMFSGGSAFGLDAASGVMKYLDEHALGYETTFGKIPIVCGASLYDLLVGDVKARPDLEMGYAAAAAAFDKNSVFMRGNSGAGTGATVGKYLGTSRMMKSGLGAAALRIGEIKVGAVAAVNAIGDVYNVDTGEIIAGMLAENGASISGTSASIIDGVASGHDALTVGAADGEGDRRSDSLSSRKSIVENTTLVCVVTNAILTKAQASRVATLAHDGMARAVSPVHTSADGDAAFAMASGRVRADADAVACIAADMVSAAVQDAVMRAEPAYGLPCARDFL